MSVAGRDIYLAPDGGRPAEHGAGVVSLTYPDGTVRIQHHCRTIGGRGHGPQRIYAAPTLTPGGHRVVQADPLTIEPSILCPDCGLHGWIRNGAWVSA